MQETANTFQVSSFYRLNFDFMKMNERIIAASQKLFMRYGFKGVSMDDIAEELGVSKKTIYLHIENKLNLINTCLMNHFNEKDSEINRIEAESENAIDGMAQIARYVTEMLQELSPVVLYDLKKYYTQSYQKFEQHQANHIFRTLRRNIERGIREGLYREGINADILARLYVRKASALVDPDFMEACHCTSDELFRHLVSYHLYGIVSESGRAFLQQYDFWNKQF